jgi:hypothetical protein
MGYLFPFSRSIRRSQDYGANPNNGINPAGGHNGDDYATNVGTPVRAAGDGVIIFAGQFDTTYADNFAWNLNFGGLMAILNTDGENGPYFEYGHLSKLLVSSGQRVKRGDIIALTGNTDGGTGVSTGPHCHVGALPPNFNLNSSTYGRVNPRSYMTDYWEDEPVRIQPQGNPVQPKEWDEMASKEDLKAGLREVLTEAPILDAIALAILKRDCYLVDPSGKTGEIVGTTSLAKKINWMAHNDAQILNAIVDVSKQLEVAHPSLPTETIASEGVAEVAPVDVKVD